MRLYTLCEVTKCDIVTFFVDGASQDFWNVKNVLWLIKNYQQLLQ